MNLWLGQLINIYIFFLIILLPATVDLLFIGHYMIIRCSKFMANLHIHSTFIITVDGVNHLIDFSQSNHLLSFVCFIPLSKRLVAAPAFVPAPAFLLARWTTCILHAFLHLSLLEVCSHSRKKKWRRRCFEPSSLGVAIFCADH